MSEPRTSLRQDMIPRTAGERAKTLHEIDDQYSRIDNRLYRQYLDYEISEEEFQSRRRAIQNAYDRYQTNILNTEIPGWRRGNAYPRNFTLYDQRIPRSVYARRNRNQ